MFTLQHINDIHARFGNAETLAQYLQALRAIGVATYDSFVTDGHSVYIGDDGAIVVSPAVHEVLTIAPTSDREQFLEQLELHQQGKTNYLEMSQGLAASGIEKWTFDTNAMTLAYYDQAGNQLLSETIQ
jgi:uncharacterized protein YbcV (DUF1398 family)